MDEDANDVSGREDNINDAGGISFDQVQVVADFSASEAARAVKLHRGVALGAFGFQVETTGDGLAMLVSDIGRVADLFGAFGDGGP